MNLGMYGRYLDSSLHKLIWNRYPEEHNPVHLQMRDILKGTILTTIRIHVQANELCTLIQSRGGWKNKEIALLVKENRKLNDEAFYSTINQYFDDDNKPKINWRSREKIHAGERTEEITRDRESKRSIRWREAGYTQQRTDSNLSNSAKRSRQTHLGSSQEGTIYPWSETL